MRRVWGLRVVAGVVAIRIRLAPLRTTGEHLRRTHTFGGGVPGGGIPVTGHETWRARKARHMSHAGRTAKCMAKQTPRQHCILHFWAGARMTGPQRFDAGTLSQQCPRGPGLLLKGGGVHGGVHLPPPPVVLSV